MHDFLIKNFLSALPSIEDLEKIEKKVEEIYGKRYKKIIFYAMGTSRQILNLVKEFYSFENLNFEVQIISDFSTETTKYLTKEVQKENFIIFCTRTGNTHEIIFQLKKIIENINDDSNLDNILVLTNTKNRSKTSIIANNNKIDLIHVNNGQSGRFECQNGIFFFMIELMHKINDLQNIGKKFSSENIYKNLFEEMSLNIDNELINGLLTPNHSIIVYSSNNKLNGLLSWFKHLWYESFGKIKINFYLEDYSSMFHSSSQYYLSHPNDYYQIIQFYSDDSEVEYLQENFRMFLTNSTIIKIKIDDNASSLLSGLIKSIAFIAQLATFFDIDFLSQEHVDDYKKRLINRFL